MGLQKIKNNEKELLAILLIIILFSTLIIFFINSNKLLMWDEPVYLSNARAHLEETHFIEDFRFPLIEYVLAIVWFLFGISVLSAQITILFFSIMTLLFYYLISKRIHSKPLYRILSTILFSTSYVFIFWSYKVYPDVPSLCLLLASVYFFFKFKENENKKSSLVYIGLSGIATSTSFLFKFPGAISALIIIPYLIYKKKIKESIGYSIGNLLVLGPWMINNFIKYSSPLWDLLSQSKVIDTYTAHQPYIIFWQNFILASGILIIFLIIFLAYYLKDKNFYNQTIFIILILSLFYYHFGIKLKLLRYQLMIIPFVLILSTKGIEYFIESIKKLKIRKNLKFILILLTIIIILLSVGNQLGKSINELSKRNEVAKDSAFLRSIEFAEENIPSGELIISNYWPWFGFYGNHKARSIWDNNLSLVLHDLDEGYLFWVIHKNEELIHENLTFNGELIKNITDEKENIVLIYKITK